jgi:hypothetical protein
MPRGKNSRNWTNQDLKVLYQLYTQGVSWKIIARRFNTSIYSASGRFYNSFPEVPRRTTPHRPERIRFSFYPTDAQAEFLERTCAQLGIDRNKYLRKLLEKEMKE